MFFCAYLWNNLSDYKNMGYTNQTNWFLPIIKCKNTCEKLNHSSPNSTSGKNALSDTVFVLAVLAVLVQVMLETTCYNHCLK